MTDTLLNEANTTPATVLQRIEAAIHVYRGKAGKCCCGCSGKHRYTTAGAEEGGKKRGYAVTAEDINDRYVAQVKRAIIEHMDIAEVTDTYIAVEIDGRLLIAYAG